MCDKYSTAVSFYKIYIFLKIDHKAVRHFVDDIDLWAVGKFFGKGRTVRKVIKGRGDYAKEWNEKTKNHSFWEFTTSFTDYLELGKSFTMQFLCSIAVQVMEEFHLSCSSILGILDELLIHKCN